MVLTIIIMALVAGTAAAVAFVVRSRDAGAPVSAIGEPPSQLRRADFRAPDAEWLMVVFSADSCSTCAKVWSEVSSLDSPFLAAQNVEVEHDADLHRRYKIESVPLTVLADSAGHVVKGFFGPLGRSEHEQFAAILAGNEER